MCLKYPVCTGIKAEKLQKIPVNFWLLNDTSVAEFLPYAAMRICVLRRMYCLPGLCLSRWGAASVEVGFE